MGIDRLPPQLPPFPIADVQIIYATPELIPSFYQTLLVVAAEKIYLDLVETPAWERVLSLQQGLMKQKVPVYYAVAGGQVIGWCSIYPETHLCHAHRSRLVTGLLPDFRGFGLGSRLLQAALSQAEMDGVEKVELYVYTDNLPAIHLYLKMGFEEEGRVRRYRKYQGEYKDALLMGKLLG